MLLALTVASGSISARSIFSSGFNNQDNKMNKSIRVKHVEFNSPAPSFLEIDKKFESEKITSNNIDVVNWPDANGDYKPVASFKIMYTDTDIYIRYDVREKNLKAIYGSDEGAKPWTDDCMEFFIMPNPEDGVYYNLEMNCIGYGLLGSGAGRGNRTGLSPEEMKQIRRFSTLGDKAFGIREIEKENASVRNTLHRDSDVCKSKETPEYYEWQMIIVLPIKLISHNGVKPLQGRTIKGNVYKCGDDMPQAHYITWNPIGTPKPDYHQPAYFGKFIFEK